MQENYCFPLRGMASVVHLYPDMVSSASSMKDTNSFSVIVMGSMLFSSSHNPISFCEADL